MHNTPKHVLCTIAGLGGRVRESLITHLMPERRRAVRRALHELQLAGLIDRNDRDRYGLTESGRAEVAKIKAEKINATKVKPPSALRRQDRRAAERQAQIMGSITS